MKINIFPRSIRDQLATKKGFVSLSLSSKTTQNVERLSEIFEWSNQNLQSFDVIVGDYFHRHNLQSFQSIAPNEANELASMEGNKVKSQVSDLLNTLHFQSINIKLASEIYNTNGANERFAELVSSYSTLPEFKSKIDLASTKFIQRFAPDKLENNDFLIHSRDYQLEELVLFEILQKDNYVVNVYPGAHLPIMKAIIKGFSIGSATNLDKYILVELR
jgi:tRNA-dependent cyclodipeptide synthase